MYIPKGNQTGLQAGGTPSHVVVLGAGPAGLSCAHELAQRGIRSTVLERNAFVGGLCRTVEHKGYRFDLGGHRWYTKNTDLHRWFLELMHGELAEVKRVSRIFHNDRFFHYPIDIADLLRKLSLSDITKAFWGFGTSSFGDRLKKRRPQSMEQAYVAQYGRPLYEMFFKTYSEKVWGRSCAELSADWVAQRSAGLSLKDVIFNALSGDSPRHESLIDKFSYPRRGYSRISERLAEGVRKSGNEVILNANVKRIHSRGDNDFEVLYESGDEEKRVRGDAVVSTIPLGYLANIIEPEIAPDVKDCARSLAFRDLITVALMLDTPRVSSDSWVYVQDRKVIFSRFHEPANWSEDMVPDGRHTSLILECFCSRGDEIWSLSDDELVRRCVLDLSEKLKFIQARQVVDSVVVRTINAYPVYDLHYAEKLKRINSALCAYQGLETIGRGGTFRYNNSDHSIEMGLLCARKLAGETVDHRGVNTENEYNEVRYIGNSMGQR